MFEPDAKTPSLMPRAPDPGAFETALEFPYEAEHGRTTVPAAAPTRERPIAARILWPALGFPAVIAPGSVPEGAPTAQRCVCVLLVTDRPTLTADEAARHLRVVPWAERDRRRIEKGQPGSFSPADLTIRSDAPGGKLTKAQKDDRGDLVVFGGDRYEDSIAASLSRAVRTFYATQGLRHLHEIRVAERASARLPDGQYHVFWNGSADGGPSDELRMLVDHFAVPRRRRLAADTEAERRWLQQNLGFLVDEYRFDYGSLHPPYQARDAQRRFTEVLHPLFVRRGPADLRLAHLTDTHVDVRADVYEHNLRRAPAPMSAAGGELRYRGIPVRFNNWNRAFTRQYEHAKHDADAILITGDLIDYGRGHIGLIHDGRYRHELGVDGRYHPDRNWFLFYYLLASGPRYSRPVYTSLGNHDWRLNPYPPFAPGAPDPEALVHNSTDLKGPGREGWLRDIVRHAHGPGHDRQYAYPDLDLRRVARAAAGYLTGNLDFAGSPLQTTVESVIWYLLLLNPFLDYAFALPTGHRVLMLDWGEDEEVLNSDEPRSWMGFGQRAANSLSALQRWHVTSFARSRGPAKVVGVHAPLLGPYPDWTDDDLRQGKKAYRAGEDSRMRRPDGQIVRVPRHTITAIRPKDAPFGVSAEHGSIVRERDWLIRELGTSSSGVRVVLSGHIHRYGLLVAYPPVKDRHSRLLRSVTLAEVRGARRGMAAVRREAGRVRAFPAPLYVNTTSAGPRGNLYGAQWRAVPPGWILLTLAADGTIESVSPRQLGAPEAQRPPRPAAARGVSTVTR
jgi:hypothetical protein